MSFSAFGYLKTLTAKESIIHIYYPLYFTVIVYSIVYSPKPQSVQIGLLWEKVHFMAFRSGENTCTINYSIGFQPRPTSSHSWSGITSLYSTMFTLLPDHKCSIFRLFHLFLIFHTREERANLHFFLKDLKLKIKWCSSWPTTKS